jgi:hypothetical protein
MKGFCGRKKTLDDAGVIMRPVAELQSPGRAAVHHMMSHMLHNRSDTRDLTTRGGRCSGRTSADM